MEQENNNNETVETGEEKMAKTGSIDSVLTEWQSKKRRMGCVAATDWAVKRLKAFGFRPLRLDRFTADGEIFQHVVAYNGRIILDLAPYADKPREY